MSNGVKRSLFSKPAWAAPATAKPDPTTSKNESIFSRSVAYDDIVRAQKAERERKAAKAKARAEKEKDQELKDGHESKRRRISTEKEDLDGSDSDELEEDNTREKPVTRSTPNGEKTLQNGVDLSPQARGSPRRRNQKTYVVNLDSDDEDGELIMLTPPKPKNATLKKSKAKEKDDLDEENSEEEDEYLRELKQKAREKARLQREQGGRPDNAPSTPLSSSTPAAVGDEHLRSSSTPRDLNRPESSNSVQSFGGAKPVPAPPQDDPEVKILIQSEIPGAKSLIVKRKASQSLQQVKDFWCKKFDLDEAVAREVFFMWRGTRLFGSTTMRGIIAELKKDAYHKQRSLSTISDAEDGDGFDERTTKDPSGGNIMLEAVTQDVYDRNLREKEKQRRRDQQESDEDESEEQGQSAAAASAASQDKDAGAIIIRLVAKNLEPVQLRVRPHTTVGKIMRGFAATRKIGDDHSAWLIFEGEKLDPEMTVEEVGFEDEEQVEVSVREGLVMGIA